MSRKEDFKKASQSLEIQVISNPWTLFEKGCEYGYQYAVEKACEWLENNAYLYVNDIDQINESALIGDFRGVMEE